MKDLLKLAVSLISIIGFFIVGIAGMVLITSAVMGTEIIIESWTALFWFAAGTFLWIIPLQVIDWMKLIPVQRRMRRILYPYFVTFLQVVFFAVYMIGLNSTISHVVFSNMGLVTFTFVLILSARLIYTWFVRYIRKYKKPRVGVSA
ncbi:hypothetical protein K8O68_08970 [Salipaludibacillus sp. CUR1]|uniref:hypothetical protein n=1 Tax=Salipaludibacillus sp. CUR1 TaxID=2820003 RepID=UPI001E64101B|nr:hypothetical protein [Salipaludibacillus sp. CUR1]MCE7792547.1 hypothetical protein [Salipaludibacillus sp. CUR1]